MQTPLTMKCFRNFARSPQAVAGNAWQWIFSAATRIYRLSVGSAIGGKPGHKT
jgi:hypothetical protein